MATPMIKERASGSPGMLSIVREILSDTEQWEPYRSDSHDQVSGAVPRQMYDIK